MKESPSVPVLQAALVDLLDLGLQCKQAHWNVQGRHFRPVHEQLDEIYAALTPWQDEVAERITAIGSPPDGSAATIAKKSQVKPLPTGFLKDEEVIKQFTDRLDAVARRIEADFDKLEEDLPSQDILIAIVIGLDKYTWFFRAHLA